MPSLTDAAASGPPTKRPQGTIDVTPDGGSFSNVVVQGEINGDWSKVFNLFHLDPNQFEVVDDTVRMSTWQQSKATDDGRRDVIQLWSYSARFRRVNKDMVSPKTVERWRKALLKADLPEWSTPSTGHGTYVIPVADPQLGKKRTQEAVANWKRGITRHLAKCWQIGTPAVHIAFMGDETEGVANNYENQPHTIELNLSEQLELDFDLRVWTIKEALKLGVPVSASSVISNHGEWTRNGSKDPVTTSSDNASTHIARQVKKLFDELHEAGAAPKIEWYIGSGHPGLTITLSGVECYFSHGYIEKGRGGSTEQKTKAAIERQILGRTEDLGSVKLWFMAHYHHAYYQEFEGRTLFGCPALEAERSSEYMLDQFGVWSPPGMLGLVVTDANPRGWEDKNIF